MNLIKYRPLTAGLLGRDLDNLMENVFGEGFWDFDVSHPKVDVKEEENHYILEADLPGVNENDIEVKVENNLLTLSSKKQEVKEENKNGYILKERKGYSFARSFVLPENIDRDSIEAVFKNGVLKLTINKKEEAKPKTIEIKAN